MAEYVGLDVSMNTVVMEACGSAHYWGREIAKLGHTVKLIAPAYVKPFVKRQKNVARRHGDSDLLAHGFAPERHIDLTHAARVGDLDGHCAARFVTSDDASGKEVLDAGQASDAGAGRHAEDLKRFTFGDDATFGANSYQLVAGFGFGYDAALGGAAV